MGENKAAAHLREEVFRNFRGRGGFHDVNQPAASISPLKCLQNDSVDMKNPPPPLEHTLFWMWLTQMPPNTNT